MQKYTIIVTVYNKEKYLKRCLDSVCNQTFKNYRVMVINDGSTDKSEEIILEYKKNHKLDYYFKENTGVADSRNYAIKRVKTSFFTFVDADDYISLDLLEKVDRYNDYDVLSFGGDKYTPEGKYIKSMSKVPYKGRGDLFLVELYHHVCDFTVPWGYVYRTSFFLSKGFEYPYGRILEDYYLTPIVLMEAKKVISIDYKGYFYIETPNSIITSSENQQIIRQNYLDFYDMQMARLEKVEIDSYVEQEYKAYIVYNLIWYGSTLKGHEREDYIKKLFEKDVFKHLKGRGINEKLRIFMIKNNLYYPFRKVALFLLKIIKYFSKFKVINLCIIKPLKIVGTFIKKMYFALKYHIKKYLLRIKQSSKKCKIITLGKNFLKKIKLFYPIKWHIFLPLKYKWKYRNLINVVESYQNKRVYFYGDEHLSKQIAYVLKLKKASILKNFDKKILKAKYIFLKMDKHSKCFIKKNHLYKRHDYILLKDIYHFYDQKYPRSHIKRRSYTNYEKIKILSAHKIKTSEMLIAAINAPALNINCHNLENWAYVDTFGDLWGCCRCWPYYPHGNLLKEGADAFDNHFARILKLTSLNRNYALCNFNNCKYHHREYNEHYQLEYVSPSIPTEITVAHDKRCNLKCPSCRKEFCIPTPDEERRSNNISQKLIESGWLSKSELIVAGDGEVFYSKAYRDLIQSDLKRNKIVLLTNGTLFNEKNYQLVKNKYDHIVVMLSLDAATKETYKLLRGANFDNLLKNLQMIGKLRALNEIEYFVINFTIQRANYREIKKLIELCQELNVDSINLTRLNNWGTFTDEEYLEKSMIIDNSYYAKEVYEYFEDPIFNLPIVDLGPIKGLLDNSKEIYRK